jgi:hypothetical protein
MAVHLVLVLAMFLWREVVFDVSTREVVSFGIADAQAASGAEVFPPKTCELWFSSRPAHRGGSIPLGRLDGTGSRLMRGDR